MEKRVYTKPMLESETFALQYYCANCGDTEFGDYLFECNAPRGEELGGYKPCSEKHQASTQDEFYWEYVDYNDNRKMNPGEEVIVWLERGWFGGIRDYHATKKLDQDSWEHAKS